MSALRSVAILVCFLILCLRLQFQCVAKYKKHASQSAACQLEMPERLLGTEPDRKHAVLYVGKDCATKIVGVQYRVDNMIA